MWLRRACCSERYLAISTRFVGSAYRRTPRRYLHAQDLADDLKRYLDGETIQARGLSWFELCMRWARQQPGLAVTWIAIALFYGWHLLHQYVLPGATWPLVFHLWSTLFAVVWASGAWGFQRALLRYGGRSRILFAWATMDVLLLTLYLSVAGNLGAVSGLVYLYFPIVAVSSLLQAGFCRLRDPTKPCRILVSFLEK